MNGWFKKMMSNIWNKKESIKKMELAGGQEFRIDLLQLSNAIDEFYLLEQLKIHCYFLSYSGLIHPNAIKGKIEDIQVMISVLKRLESKMIETPPLKVFITIRKLFKEVQTTKVEIGNDVLFLELKVYLKQKRNSFNRLELIEVYSFLSNYVIKRYNLGYTSYFIEIANIYNDIINLMYNEQGKGRYKLPASVYRNIISVCLHIKDKFYFKNLKTVGIHPINPELGFSDAFEWAEKFADFFQSKLPRQERDKYYKYCKALISFQKGDFLTAYDYLESLPTVNGLFINIHLKILHLKTLYEVWDKDLLLKQNTKNTLDLDLNIEKKIDAYRDILKRDKFNKTKLSYQRDYFTEFLFLFRKLFYLNSKYRDVYVKGDLVFQKKKNELNTLLEECKSNYKPWLDKKFNEFVKK